MSQEPQVSVVTPTHGRRDSLLRVLRALGHQSVPRGSFEVVVVCDGDVDGTVAACRSLAPTLPYTLRVLEQTNQGPAAARNCGVASASAQLIVFLDDDVVPDDQLIAAHLAAQAGQDRRVTIGPLLPPRDVSLNLWGAFEERALCRQYEDMEAGRWQATFRQFYTGNASVRKQHVLEAGGFDPAFRRAEDVELALRLHRHGLHFVFLPEARGWHYVRRSFASWLRMPVAYGEADVAMARAGNPWVLNWVVREYHGRHRLARFLTQMCVGRRRARQAVMAVLGTVAQVLDTVRVVPHADHICSLIFNVLYYDGVTRGLGGRERFQALLRGVPVVFLLIGSENQERTNTG